MLHQSCRTSALIIAHDLTKKSSGASHQHASLSSPPQAGPANDRPFNFIDLLGQRISAANVVMPSVTVEFRDLTVAAEAVSAAAAVPTVGSIPVNFAKVRAVPRVCLLGIFPAFVLRVCIQFIMPYCCCGNGLQPVLPALLTEPSAFLGTAPGLGEVLTCGQQWYQH